MEPRYYMGLDGHKLNISYCLKDGGEIQGRPRVPPIRQIDR
jgi:hypothetical protein